jgi:excisionase family DNA binding protein
MPELITTTEFCTRVGISRPTLTKAIQNGRISTQVQGKRHLIDWDTAKIEWEGNRAKDDVTARYIAPSDNSKPVPIEQEQPKEESEQVPTMVSFKITKLRIDTELKKIELAKAKNVLVEKAMVNQKLQKMGTEIRQAFQLIPAQVIDDVMAAKTRIEALDILVRSIERTLMDLSELEI